MEPGFIFLHIGKTGGSSMKNAMKRHEAATGEKIATLLSHKESLAAILESDIPGEICFSVRDPVKRYVSGFNSRQRRGKWGKNDWSQNEQQVFTLFPDPNALAEALSSTDVDLRKKARWSMNKSRHISKDLKHYLVSVELLESAAHRIAFIGHLPTLDDDYKLFRRMTGIGEDIELLTDDRISHRTPDTQVTDLSETGAANIRKWYADDYPIYEWCLKHRERLMERHGAL